MKTPHIFIDKKGRWFQDGIQITHRWTYLENNRNLRRAQGGGFEVAEGKVSISVEVEDTPFVIVSARLTEKGLEVIVNDETSEMLTEDADLRVNADNIPYAFIKNGEFEARFLSPAYYAIASAAEPLPEGGFVIKSQGKKYRFSPKTAQ
ncbi:hypothetical protein [Candidatus Mycalebacterium sp.]